MINTFLIWQPKLVFRLAHLASNNGACNNPSIPKYFFTNLQLRSTAAKPYNKTQHILVALAKPWLHPATSSHHNVTTVKHRKYWINVAKSCNGNNNLQN